MTEHAVLLDRLARLAIHTGLNLEPGQEILLAAPLESAPLVRLIAAHGYKAGAKLVTPLFSDDATALARYQHARAESFDYAAQWLFEATAVAMRNGAARLTIAGDDPNLLAGQDPDKTARANRARAMASRGPLELLTSFETNWSIVPYATAPWARLVFPDVPEAEAVQQLWDAIFAITRADRPDPVAAWAEHGAVLQARTRYLTEAQFDALRFRGPGTDLRVGLSERHIWLGGPTTTKKGLVTIPNMPTEEVFTTPHFAMTEGYVRSTKPLSYSGTLIKDIEVRFEQGRIVHAQASAGLEVLEKVLGTDEGARRLGEVALVPHSSPISASGLLFYNTLFDENAASHLAIGQAYRICLEGGTSAGAEELERRGANTSLIHIDWMVGSGDIDVDGEKDGELVPVMRQGEFLR